ncbi:hypothetical protein EDC96DRAFT_561389, partial [Choanephora cucurbitarum]
MAISTASLLCLYCVYTSYFYCVYTSYLYCVSIQATSLAYCFCYYYAQLLLLYYSLITVSINHLFLLCLYQSFHLNCHHLHYLPKQINRLLAGINPLHKNK